MKKLLKIVAVVFSLSIFLAAGALAYVTLAYPKGGPVPDLKVRVTQRLLARGKYLATHVAACIDCHSTRDWGKFAGPIVPGSHGKGGERFGREFGFPGEIYSPNITAAGLGSWTDGEIARAITNGVRKDGSAIFKLMPFPAYASLCQDDLDSIIAYIRSLPSVANVVAKTKLDFPVNLLVRLEPRNSARPPCPSPTDGAAYGKYLTTIAACGECHTPQKRGKKLAGMDFAGGFEFKLAAGTARSTNITPDPQTGLGKWSKDDFVSRFQQYAQAGQDDQKVTAGSMNTVMPWLMYAGMTRQDLEAIYDFLRRVRPVVNQVKSWTPR